jgi:hypothetical protein
MPQTYIHQNHPVSTGSISISSTPFPASIQFHQPTSIPPSNSTSLPPTDLRLLPHFAKLLLRLFSSFAIQVRRGRAGGGRSVFQKVEGWIRLLVWWKQSLFLFFVIFFLIFWN